MSSRNFHVRQAAVSALRAWSKGHDYAETLVERHAHRRNLSAPDRALLQSILFTVLRNRRLLDHWIGILRKGKLDAETRDVLRVGLCQTLLLGIPDHAAVNETVESGKAAVRGLINAVLRQSIQRRAQLLDELPSLQPAVRLSHPDEWFNRWKSAFGKEAAIQLMEWNNQPAETFFRINPLVETAELPAGQAVEAAAGFFKLDGPIPNAALASGSLYIQDPATRHCVELLDPKPGESVLDACAAPGGKAFLIAASLGGGHGLVCTDSNDKRLPRLAENLTRLHIHGAEILAHDWTQPAPSTWDKRFDAILLDVPCSNSGVMRRRVDVRWRFKPADLTNLRITQLAILENAFPCLKPGGRMVYSTCSIDPEENIELVRDFETLHPELTLRESREIVPFRDGTDGAFAACLRRN